MSWFQGSRQPGRDGPQAAGSKSYSNIRASGNSRQHNGDHHGPTNNGPVYGTFASPGVVHYRVDNEVGDQVRRVIDTHSMRLERQSSINTRLQEAQVMRDYKERCARQHQASTNEQHRRENHNLNMQQGQLHRRLRDSEQRERRAQMEVARLNDAMRNQVRNMARGQAAAVHQLNVRQNRMMQEMRFLAHQRR